ncbi:hypothetical protein FAP39_13935 [Shimia litoralis]|uniref:Uncharacterized protein n=1 Tax=Shimia litoralis TaxID=420403 RepID=A0A4U7MWX0_9RHOB|nr:hypothetical protein FAP39_13935 [Shimia litoralis]
MRTANAPSCSRKSKSCRGPDNVTTRSGSGLLTPESTRSSSEPKDRNSKLSTSSNSHSKSPSRASISSSRSSYSNS